MPPWGLRECYRMQFAQKVVRWQRRHGRRDLPWQGTRDPYRIWLSEVMLQQTQVSTVIPYYERFIQKYPTPQALARASEEQVLELWSGLGYYARGRNLHRAARLIAQRGFPRTAEAIAELPGVGRSTAAAIAAFAYGERPARAKALPAIEHGFTHFRLRIHPLLCEVQKRTVGRNAGRWLKLEEASAAALPAPVKALLARLPAAGH